VAPADAAGGLDTLANHANDKKGKGIQDIHLQQQANEREEGRKKKKLTSLTPGTDSTVRAAWFPT
jgi:hypothetical protein